MTRYLLSIYQPDEGQPDPDSLERIMSDLDSLNQEMQDAGVWVFAAGLHPASTATVLSVKGPDLMTTDGPYIEGKEHIGGFTVIEAPDLDAALAWGGKLARVLEGLSIEVRPLYD